MSKYPIFLEMEDRKAVIIGAGVVAVRKAEALLQTGARVAIVSDDPHDKTINLAGSEKAEIVRSKYDKQYIVEADIVIAATNNRQVNERVYKDCQELKIWCNVVDQPELCDFYVPAVVQRGNLQVAISTSGSCPAFSGHLRKKFEQILTEKHGKFVEELRTIREKVLLEVAEPERKAVLGQLVDDESFAYFNEKGPAAWSDRAEKIISEHKTKV